MNKTEVWFDEDFLFDEETLYSAFSKYYDVNRWSPESGFKCPLEFYIHETWKRDRKEI